MIFHHAPQGSEEWHAARAGVITASNVKLIRERLQYGPDKGGFSKKALDYAFRLAIERISGKPLDEGFETWAMARGHELEPMARMEHQIRSGLIVDTVGFITTEDGRFGCSADGMIGTDGGAEYKCFIDPVKLRSILIAKDLSEVRDQCLFGMAVTGREWWDFGLYCPALEPIDRHFTCHRIYRDDDEIDRIWTELLAFERLVSQYEARLRDLPESSTAAPWDAAAAVPSPAPVAALLRTPAPAPQAPKSKPAPLPVTLF